MSLSVQFIGTGSALPKPEAHPSCQYVFCENRHLLIDCGEGSQMQLKKFGVKLQSIQHILISHLHGDHFFGLPGLLSSMHLLGRDKPIDIWGPTELEEIIRPLLEVGRARLGFELNFHEIEKDYQGLLFEDKVWEVSTFKLKHKVPTHGFVIKEKPKPRPLLGEKYRAAGHSIVHINTLKSGQDAIDENGQVISYLDFTEEPKKSKSFAYCSDTAFSEEIIEFIEGVDVLYHESTFLEFERDRAKHTKHSTAMDAARIAKAAKVSTLYIGHLSARYRGFTDHIEEARSIFEETHAAKEGSKVQF